MPAFVHAFLMSDLRLRREGRSLLPQGEVLVIDEAHRLDDVATEHLAVRFDSERLYSCVSAPLLSGADGWLAATRFTFLMTLPEVEFMPWSARFDRVVLAGLKIAQARLHARPIALQKDLPLPRQPLPGPRSGLALSNP